MLCVLEGLDFVNFLYLIYYKLIVKVNILRLKLFLCCFNIIILIFMKCYYVIIWENSFFLVYRKMLLKSVLYCGIEE